MNLASVQRFNHKLYKIKVPIIPDFIYALQFLIFNSSVPKSTVIGKGTKFAYMGIGVVVHARAVIGTNCVLGQGITIGGRGKGKNVPKIGNDCYIGAGARILGEIEIGDGVIIGPNAVVIDSIPSNSIAVGIPARIIRSGIRKEDYI